MLQQRAEQLAARRAVAAALRAGRLSRPLGCSVCGRQGRIEAHHPDYSKPLEVIWLCNLHHKLIEHKILFGQDLIAQARRLRQAGLSYQYIASRLGISQRRLRQLI